MTNAEILRAPFPYFGGKSSVASDETDECTGMCGN